MQSGPADRNGPIRPMDKLGRAGVTVRDRDGKRGEDMKVTPWEVEGEVDYDKLIEEFGIQKITDELLDKVERLTGELHFMLRRRIFFAHRDFDWILNEYEKGNKFYLYTGRGPSGHTHLGHLLPWVFTKWLQDKFDAELYFQITDDEKYLHRNDLSLTDVKRYAYENVLDVIAVGFDENRTRIFIDTEYAKTLYPQAIRVAKHITFSTASAVFGFTPSTNVGLSFYTSMQSVPAFLKSVEEGRNVPCLIPHAVDQDPHFRIARDVLPKLGYYKPASVQCIFFPGLKKGGKMSASDPDSTIFTTDDPETVRRKVYRAFTGGRDTVEEQKRLGGRPEVCTVFAYYRMFFEPDDRELNERYQRCKSGALTCGECKRELADRITRFLEEHRKRRERARLLVDRYLVRD